MFPVCKHSPMSSFIAVIEISDAWLSLTFDDQPCNCKSLKMQALNLFEQPLSIDISKSSIALIISEMSLPFQSVPLL